MESIDLSLGPAFYLDVLRLWTNTDFPFSFGGHGAAVDFVLSSIRRQLGPCQRIRESGSTLTPGLPLFFFLTSTVLPTRIFDEQVYVTPFYDGLCFAQIMERNMALSGFTPSSLF